MEQNPQSEASKPRKRHPLEMPPRASAPPPQQPPPANRGVLHLPVVPATLTRWLIIINTAIFALGFLSPALNNSLWQFGWNYAPAVLQGGEFHRLFTAMFLHGDVAHIFVNMYSLYILGNTVERVFGHMRFALVYFGGGLAGSVLSVVLGGWFTPSLGASGAIFALLGAEIVFLYQNRKLMGERAKSRRNYLLFLAALNLGLGLISTRIDNFGHIGGLLGGLVLGWLLSPVYLLRSHPDYAEEQKHIIAEDINNVDGRIVGLSLYMTAVLGLLLVGVYLAR